MESKALSNILERNSPRQLIEPHPNAEQMKLVYEAALRAPDLSGGQMIKKKVPGKGTMYDFEGDIPAIKDKIRTKIDNTMAEEAKLVFDFATNTFKELMEI